MNDVADGILHTLLGKVAKRRQSTNHDRVYTLSVTITGSAVALPCINGDIQSQWEMANFDPLQNGNPFTDCQQK